MTQDGPPSSPPPSEDECESRKGMTPSPQSHRCTDHLNHSYPVPDFKLAAVDPLADLDTDSDSDIVPLPGLPSTRPYPNCCRWHLTDARCRYKWQDRSICAPFSIRVASVNYYSPAQGTLNDILGVRAQLHSPIDNLEELPATPPSTIAIAIGPEVAQSSPPPPMIAIGTEVAQSSLASPLPSSSVLPQPSSPAPPSPSPSSQRWYAITKGRSLCVVQGWCVIYHE